MGIFDFISKQFIDIIEWNESQDGILSWRFPVADQEIQNGGKLTVRESQMVLFVNEGRIADQFGPGMYTLTTQTLPVLTALKNWDKGFNSPFKSDVYFFSTRDQIDQKWGTPTPLTIRDKEYGPIRIRAYGVYSYRMNEPRTFFRKVSGTRDTYTTEELEGQLSAMILTNMATFLGSTQVPFLDMAGNQQAFSETLKTALAPAFVEYGLELASFYVQSVSLPEELQKYLDKQSQGRLVGNMDTYTRLQTADAIGDAAKNPGGVAGIGVGVGVGQAIGQAMAGGMAQQQAPPPGPTPTVSAAAAEDIFATLDKLKGLLDRGIISQDEFNAKKAELMKKIA